MGIDIYAYVEVFDGNRWLLLHHGDINIPRSYTLFGLMGRWGSDGGGAILYRGAPNDMSAALKREEIPFRTASWLTYEEVQQIAASDGDAMKVSTILVDVLDVMRDLKGRPTRLVFWFDC